MTITLFRSVNELHRSGFPPVDPRFMRPVHRALRGCWRLDKVLAVLIDLFRELRLDVLDDVGRSSADDDESMDRAEMMELALRRGFASRLAGRPGPVVPPAVALVGHPGASGVVIGDKFPVSLDARPIRVFGSALHESCAGGDRVVVHAGLEYAGPAWTWRGSGTRARGHAGLRFDQARSTACGGRPSVMSLLRTVV
jgi:hypothetical protein